MAANCNIPLNTDDRTKGCFGKPSASNDGTFVCDVSASWMHHVGGSSEWYPATPPLGSGVHEYVAYRGQSSPPCSKNGRCEGCASPDGTRICSVKIDPTDCSVEAPVEEGSLAMESSLATMKADENSASGGRTICLVYHSILYSLVFIGIWCSRRD